MRIATAICINDSGIGPRRFDDINYTAVRASLVVDLTPDLENYTIVSYSNSDNNGSVQKLIACNPGRPRPPISASAASPARQLAREQRAPASTDVRGRSAEPDVAARTVADHQHDHLARQRRADDQEHHQLRAVPRRSALAAVRHELRPAISAVFSGVPHPLHRHQARSRTRTRPTSRPSPRSFRRRARRSMTSLPSKPAPIWRSAIRLAPPAIRRRIT